MNTMNNAKTINMIDIVLTNARCGWRDLSRKAIARLPREIRGSVRKDARFAAAGLPPSGSTITIAAGGDGRGRSETTRYRLVTGKAAREGWTGTVKMNVWPFWTATFDRGRRID